MIIAPDLAPGIEQVASAIGAARTARQGRLIVAIAGPPGSGKSTFTEGLWRRVDKDARGKVSVMPMDGYHMDNAVLVERGWLDRKGAPHTFDVDALAADLNAVRAAKREAFVPVFDRTLDLSRASARAIGTDVETVLLEGNYLLLGTDPWLGLQPLFDLTVYLDVDAAELERRLIARWLTHGHDAEAARKRALGNDIPNARLVAEHSLPATITLKNG